MVNNTMTKISKISMLVASVVALSACSMTATDKAKHTNQIGQDRVDNAIEAQKLNNGSLYKIDRQGVYVDKTPIDTLAFDNKKNLPKVFNQHVTITTMQSKNKLGLAAYLKQITGIKVVIQQDLLDDTFGSSGSLIGSTGEKPAPMVAGEYAQKPVVDAVIDELVYSGTKRGLFDHVASKLNVSWKYENGAVEIYKYETKMFSLDALSGTSKLSANLNTNSNSASGTESSSGSISAQSGQTTQIDNTVSVWEQVGSAIQSVLSENEKLSLTPSAGKVVVMATPAHMRKVENLIKEFNKFYSRLVRLDVKVYQVETTDKDNYGINWSAAWKAASDKLDIGVNMGGAITNNVVTVAGKGGAMTSGKAIFDVLSTAGKTSLLRHNSVVTLNNQTAPLNVAKEISYVQSTSVTAYDNSSSTEINPGVVTEGFSMNLTPLVNDKGEVLLQYSVDSSTVEDIETFSSADGKSSVQLPRRSIQNFLQRVTLNNGESMVLTGFQEAKGSKTDKGVGTAKAWWAGGSREADNTLKTIVVVVTPYIIK